MVRVPSCEKVVLKKGPWTPEEDQKLISFIQNHGHSSWRALPKQAGLSRCGKSCRLRWTNYLRPGIKRGNFSSQEENSIIQLHAVLGNRWSTIATHLPGRTDNEIKNHWNTRLRKRLLKMGIDPATHRPWPQQQPPNPLQQAQNSINPLLLSLLQGLPSAAHTPPSLLTSLLLGSNYPLTTNGLFPAASTPQPTPPPSSYSVSAVDPALLAAAETRLVLDCLKFSTPAQNHSSSSDDHINQLLTRLLLVKLLQSSNNHAGGSSIPAPCNDSKAMIQSIIAQQADMQRSSPLQAADHHLIYKQGLQNTALASSMLPAGMNRLINETYVHSNTHNSMHASVLFPSSSYQQRLLQSFPFLAESVIEPSTSADTEHLSSNHLSQANFITDSLTPTNGSLTSPQAPLFGCYNQVMPSGEQLLAAAGMPQGNHQHQHNAMTNSSVPTLMTWEELHMTQHKGDDRDPASSSTANTTGSSTRSSSASADPNTPTNNINIQEYWSNLLNLISSTNNNHPLTTASD